ncbi:MAG: sodium:proton antiporter NhaD [Saprospirales bacterium]|jgi:Na+/H+ antiporter NhaD/arsenite permease-like protein|nr:sodium:proton antiporter NhaD [Saprospirales bacterium]
MFTLMIIVFLVGYLAIALEHPIKIDKSASALLTGVAIWTMLILGHEAFQPADIAAAGHGSGWVVHELEHHLGEIAAIVVFLLGAMTIVELIDVHGGFTVITDNLKSKSKVSLLWALSILTFFMSAVLDNLTTAIVMSALLRKLVKDKHDLWFFAGIIIIAANSGGAWSPIGDVTTIMLWINGQISENIIRHIFIPSAVSLLVPLAIASFFIKGDLERPEVEKEAFGHGSFVSLKQRRFILFLGVGLLLFVPVFKTVTHLPPYMGILLALGVLWVVTEIMHKGKSEEESSPSMLTVASVIRRIDVPSILFFLGILLAVAGLQAAGHLTLLAETLDRTIGDIYVINTIIGVLSAVVDNVPLVAGAMGMYSLETYPIDHKFWQLLAYCAGTGGSILIIGSAAGVATMGILKIDFIWYVKRISLLALLGYLAGVLTYYFLG